MKSTIVFVLLFSLWTISLAADITVYQYFDYYHAAPGAEPKPTVLSQFPWEFSYRLDDLVNMHFFFFNKSPSVTAVNVTYSTDYGTYLAGTNIASYGPRKDELYYSVDSNTFSKSTEVDIVLKLYTSNISCSPLLVAKGRKVANIQNETPMKGLHYYSENYAAVLMVDIINKCDDTLVAARNMQTTTARMVTDFKKLNNTLIVPTSSHENLETTTNQTTGNDTSPKSTNNILIIVGSLSGVTFTLLAVIAIRKRCWVKPSPRGTADLPTNQSYQPFYVNLLFRRECALEIAELDRHVYEEINSPASEDQPVYEEINPQVTESD